MNQTIAWQRTKDAWRNLSQDKADTLLLLSTCFLILIPFSQHMPGWISVVWLSLLGWRANLTWRGLRLPPQWILVPVAVCFAAGVYLSFGKLMGKDPGVSLLLGLLTCKLLEMHAKRDLFVVLFLCYFLLLAQFFYDQSIVVALWVMVTLSVLLCTQLTFQFSNLRPGLWQRWLLATKLLGLALPFCILTFFLFPRISGPLWGMPSDAATARSGLSDTMSPGDVSKLVLSEEMVFRVKFSSLPERQHLYWRGFVLTQFDGRVWQRDRSPVQDNVKVNFYGSAIHQEITLEPNNNTWLFALDLPEKAAISIDGGRQLNLNSNFESRDSIPNFSRIRYQVESFTNYRFESQLSESERLTALSLPTNFNPLSLQFAKQIAQQFTDDKQKIDAVLRHFNQNKFEYTLEPISLGRDTVDDFLFKTKAGFCEHFAGSFVFLARAMAIPARVVTGYQGGSLNTIDGYFEVRQSDAHAWAEVWLNDKGWVRIDPTAAVAPERIHAINSSAFLRQSSIRDSFLQLSPNTLNYALSLRMYWDAMNNSWYQWVLNFNQSKQRNLLSKLGFEDVDWERTALILFGIGLALTGLLSWPFLRDKKKLSPLENVYARYCKKMASRGLARLHHEGPHAYLHRIIEQLPNETRIHSVNFIEKYSAIQYGNADINSQSLGQLKSLLRKC